MKILIDIGHPAHVHLFKNFALEMIKKGNQVLFTARDKEFEIYLLNKYGFEYKTFGEHYSTTRGKIWGLIKFNFMLFWVSLKFKPDLFLSHGSIYAAHVSYLFRKPHISLEDSGNMEQINIYRPFTKVILSPDVLPGEFGPKHIKYKGYHELTYLLPNYFNPDRSIFKELGIKDGEKYCVMRFVSWTATHDAGQRGFTYQEKKELILELSKKIKVFISSEAKIDKEFEKFAIRIPPERMHDALAFASLFIGEGATMASEAGVLGVPAIYVNSIITYNNEDLSKYGLSYCFRNGKGVLEKAKEILEIPDLRDQWQRRRIEMLKDKIDVTSFLIWFIDEYPESEKILKNDQAFQNKFMCWPQVESALNIDEQYFKSDKHKKYDRNSDIKEFRRQINLHQLNFNKNRRRKKNILVDIGHPAHVHLFRNFIQVMKKKNHKVLITVKNLPAAIELLEKYNLEFVNIGSKSDSIKGKLLNQINFNWLLYKIVRREKIDIGVGTSITLAHVSKISRMKSLIFDDDDSDVEPLFAKFAHPFADFLISPDVLIGKRGKKQTLYYPGYHELAYLHPNHFKPDPGVLKDSGLKAGEKYFILRFNAFKAHHDVGVVGLSLEKKRKLISLLKNYGKIFITTEKEIDPEFRQYQLKVSPDKIHSLIYYATMLIGDSQTMTSEAAVLGIPSIRSNSFVGRISYLEEEEHKYDLTYGFKPDEFEKMQAKIAELLSMPELKEEWRKRRLRMLDDKIDVNKFILWLVENFPESVKRIKNSSEYLDGFK